MDELIELTTHGVSLIDFFMLSSKIVCFFEDFQVKVVDLRWKRVTKEFNLQEIENFEISEQEEEDKIVSASFEKDAQLFAVACVDSVHVFGFNDENFEELLEHYISTSKKNVVEVIFMGYSLILVQDMEEEFSCMVFDMESGMTEGDLRIPKLDEDARLILRPGNQCFYYVSNNIIGGVEVPSM